MRFQPFERAFGFAVALCLGATGAFPAAVVGQPREAGPVCALLDPARVPRVALLEAQLIADPSSTWVERATIDKVLQEQTLQAAFGPQGGADRVRLGKLLKADLLVLVRPVKEAKEPALEVVVSDTARGLRLAVRAVAVTKDADADVAALREAVRAGLKKLREDVREVIAVPPFASTNLEYAYEHLKGAYAKLVEQAALAQPGVVVVELAEAEAIARELKLTDPGTTVKRPLPLYMLGEFRHQGRGADLQVALQLRAMRGGMPVGKAVAQTVAPAEAPILLRKWTADQLAAGQAGPVAPDAKTEAKQLAELCRSRQRVGDWADALALLEASLLLDPHQPELNADAMVLLKVQSGRVLERGSREIDALRRAAQLHRRGMEHMEALVTSGAKLPRFAEGPESVRGGRMFFSSFPFPSRPVPYTPFPPPNDPAEVKELIRELVHESRAAALRMLPLVVKQGTAHEVVTFTNSALWDLSTAEQYAERARLIVKYQDFPAMKAAADQLASLSPHALELEQLPIYARYLDNLEKDGNAGVRAVVARARQKLPGIEKEMVGLAARVAEQKRLLDEAIKKNLNAKPPTPVRLSKEEQANLLDERLKGGPLRQVRLKGATPDDDWFVDRLHGVVAAGPDTDVFYASGKTGPALLIMKQKGELRRVWEKPGAPDRFTAVCYDGRYVWAAVEGSRQAPALFVFDPALEMGYEVTADDGLPQPPDELARDPRRSESLSLVLAPVDAGRVCVAGSFGRAWVGVAQFDPSRRKATVKVIHEARELPRQGDKEKDLWQNRNLIFSPMYACTLRGKPDANGKVPIRVLIGRRPAIGINNNMAYFGAHPLVIDPDGPTVEVMQDSLFEFSARDSSVAADGALLVADRPPTTPEKVRLLRVEYPGTVRDLGPLDIARPHGLGPIGVSADRLHVALTIPGPGGKWFASAYWSSDLDGKDLRQVKDNVIHIRNFARSSHYGLVAWCDLYPGIALCEVKAPQLPGQ